MQQGDTIHDKARAMAAQRGISLDTAYVILGQRGAASREAHRQQGRVPQPIQPARRPERPGVRMWWAD
jgi:hypothetical protein